MPNILLQCVVFNNPNYCFSLNKSRGSYFKEEMILITLSLKPNDVI